MNKPWTTEELALLASDKSTLEIATQLNRTTDSVQKKRLRMKRRLELVCKLTTAADATRAKLSEAKTIPVTTPTAPFADGFFANPPEVAPPTYDEDKTASGNDYWRKQYRQLDAKYRKALDENSVVEQLVAEITAQAPLSYSPLPTVYTNRCEDGRTPQSAVLMFSDTHVGKLVELRQTLGFAEYNFTVFLRRLKFLEESVVSILENHTTTVIDELVIAMLGDMLDGALSHGVEAGQRSTLFSQFYMAGHAIAQFFRNLATRVPRLRIKTVVGNHTRWSNQKKMPTENRYSNLDMFLYALVEALTKDITNIEWDLNTQPFAIFEVKGFTFHAAHGDHLRGGDKALGIPNHAIGREISTKTQLFNKHGRQAPHYYLCGHMHREIKLPHAIGAVLVNGGFPGLDNYALAENFNPVDPTQTFFFMHPKFGKTAEYSLSLKFGDEISNTYDLPNQFPIE